MRRPADFCMDQTRIDRIIQAALAAAAQKDFSERELGPIHLIKYVYLADLAHAEAHGGQTYTGVPWKFHHFGPWAVPVYQRLEPATAAIGAERRQFVSQQRDDNVRWRLEDAEMFDRLERNLPWEVSRSTRLAVTRFGADTVSLLHHVYNTAPMLRAAPGEVLTFTSDSPENALSERSPATTASLSKTAAKKLQARVRSRLDEARQRKFVRPEPPPRYDQLYAEGVAWLDSLAGDEISPSHGSLHFDQSIWKSRARGDDLP